MRLFLTALLLIPSLVLRAEEAPRADPPEFTDEERAVFFPDAFEQLSGSRPDYGKAAPTKPVSSPAASDSVGSDWAAWIDAEALETEIKRQGSKLAAATTTAPRFNGGGRREASDALGLVALLMAATAEHSGSPRWRDAAAAYRDHFAVGEGLPSESDSYDRAQLLAADLQDLVRGGRPTTDGESTTPDWSTLAGRGAVMRRMAEAHEGRLPEMLVDRRALRRNAEDVRHEAQVLALLAQAAQSPGAADADSEDYQAFAQSLREAATELSGAAEANDLEAAGAAMQAIGRSCAACHEDYRG